MFGRLQILPGDTLRSMPVDSLLEYTKRCSETLTSNNHFSWSAITNEAWKIICERAAKESANAVSSMIFLAIDTRSHSEIAKYALALARSRKETPLFRSNELLHLLFKLLKTSEHGQLFQLACELRDAESAEVMVRFLFGKVPGAEGLRVPQDVSVNYISFVNQIHQLVDLRDHVKNWLRGRKANVDLLSGLSLLSRANVPLDPEVREVSIFTSLRLSPLSLAARLKLADDIAWQRTPGGITGTERLLCIDQYVRSIQYRPGMQDPDFNDIRTAYAPLVKIK
jgi:hypothetical protein